MGVAHAPDISFAPTNSRADCDTGGTKRRPVHRSEVAQNEGHRQNGPDRQGRRFCRAFDRESPAMEGERSSRVCVPPSFSPLSRILTASRGVRVRMRSTFVGPSRHRDKQDLETVLAAYENRLVAQPENGFARVDSPRKLPRSPTPSDLATAVKRLLNCLLARVCRMERVNHRGCQCVCY